MPEVYARIAVCVSISQPLCRILISMPPVHGMPFVTARHHPDCVSDCDSEDEIVSPHQTTLLKLLDSYLQPSQSRGLAADSSELRRLTEFVTRIFFTLALYTQQAIGRALGPNNARSLPESGDPRAYSLQSPSAAPSGAQALQELDLLLPKICEALVLVTQCLTSLSLISEESAGTPPRPPAPQGRPGDRATGQHLKDAISNAVAPSGEGMVECLIGKAISCCELIRPTECPHVKRRSDSWICSSPGSRLARSPLRPCRWNTRGTWRASCMPMPRRVVGPGRLAQPTQRALRTSRGTLYGSWASSLPIAERCRTESASAAGCRLS